MDRRKFLKRLAIGSVTIAVAPQVLIEAPPVLVRKSLTVTGSGISSEMFYEDGMWISEAEKEAVNKFYEEQMRALWFGDHFHR